MTPGNPELWFSLPMDVVDSEIWGRYPDRDLYVRIVRDAWVARRRSIRYSHKKYAEKVAFTDGNNPRRPGVEQMRGALRRLREAGLITYDEPRERQRQGRQQGFFIVTLVGWPPSKIDGWFIDETTPDMPPGKTDAADPTPRGKERENQKEKVEGCDGGGAGPPGQPARTRQAARGLNGVGGLPEGSGDGRHGGVGPEPHDQPCDRECVYCGAPISARTSEVFGALCWTCYQNRRLEEGSD